MSAPSAPSQSGLDPSTATADLADLHIELPATASTSTMDNSTSSSSSVSSSSHSFHSHSTTNSTAHTHIASSSSPSQTHDTSHSSTSQTYDASRPSTSTETVAETTKELPDGFDKRASGRTRPLQLRGPPSIIKRLFSYFPLRMLPAERRPALSLQAPTLRPDEDLRIELWLRTSDHICPLMPSYDLDSLIYQTYLLGHRIKFAVRNASEAASPNGRLPVMCTTSRAPTMPGTSGSRQSRIKSSILTNLDIRDFVRLRARKKKDRDRQQRTHDETSNFISPDQRAFGEFVASDLHNIQLRHEEAGLAILHSYLRPAFLWALYMTPDNFDAIIVPHYIVPAVGAAYSSPTRRSSSVSLLPLSRPSWLPQLAFSQSSASPPSLSSSPSSSPLANIHRALSPAASCIAEALHVPVKNELSREHLSPVQVLAAEGSEDRRREIGDWLYKRASEGLRKLREHMEGEDAPSDSSSTFRHSEPPTLLDATFFAYLYLLLGAPDQTGFSDRSLQGLEWRDSGLVQEVIREHSWVIAYRDQMWKFCFAPWS